MPDNYPFRTIALFFALCTASIVLADGHDGLPHAFEAGWKGEDVCEVLFENDAMVVGKCVFAPGIGHEKHYHYPHFGYILEGDTTFRNTDADGTEDIEVTSGMTWSTDAIRIHEALNVGEEASQVLIIETKP